MIVDDERGIREILARLVRRAGYEAVEAADGVHALAAIGREAPDALLLDIGMPGVDGLEVLRQAKRVAPLLPVVMITSHAGTEDIAAALQCGARAYLVKPFAHEDVLRVLRGVIPAGLQTDTGPQSVCE